MKKVVSKESTMSLDTLAKIIAKRFDQLEDSMRTLGNTVDELKETTTENLKKVRRDILEVHDTFASKDDIRKVVSRIEVLERANKKH